MSPLIPVVSCFDIFSFGELGMWELTASLCLFLFIAEVQTKKVRKVPPGLPSSVSTACFYFVHWVLFGISRRQQKSVRFRAPRAAWASRTWKIRKDQHLTLAAVVNCPCWKARA